MKNPNLPPSTLDRNYTLTRTGNEWAYILAALESTGRELCRPNSALSLDLQALHDSILSELEVQVYGTSGNSGNGGNSGSGGPVS